MHQKTIYRLGGALIEREFMFSVVPIEFLDALLETTLGHQVNHAMD